MNSLRLSATITTILGFFSLIALITLYLSLADIANQEPNLTLEWYMAGICIFVLGVFTLSTLITMALFFKSKF